MSSSFNNSERERSMRDMKAMFLDDSMSNLTSASNEASLSSSSNKNDVCTVYPPSQQLQTNKKKRNLPGNPDPEAEVIAMSPKTLMATNRFVCEICNKGFQRDQNLQLHRRGHNLPWKLKQRSKQEVVRKKVYVCPEPSCVHHEPARALGDLTGIKKHYSRKHGEKKWKCEKCSKRYAVQSDWKAHSKICGTREYRCDCGTIFSRRDSFITHRAFCGALAGETARSSSSTLLSPTHLPLHLPLSFPLKTEPHLFQYPQLNSNVLINDIQQNNQLPSWFLHHHQQPNPNPNNANNNNHNNNLDFTSSASHMSATALLQKAAQMSETMGKPASTSNTVIVMSQHQQQQQQQQQHQSILSGSHQNDHMCAPTTLLTAQHHASGLENLSSTDDNQQEMLGLSGAFANNAQANALACESVESINAFQEAYNGISGNCFQEPFFPQAAASTEPPPNPTARGGGNDELTRDFLGLTGFPPPNGDQHFLSMAGLDHLNTSSPYHHQLQQHDPNPNSNPNQDRLPWHG